MTTRLLTAADRDRVKQLDDDVLDELRADFGVVDQITLAQLSSYVTDQGKAAVGYLSGGMLLGFLLALNGPQGWQIVRIVTDKSLTAQQRITGAQDAIRFGAGLLPPNATVWGIVKAGGKLDALLQPKGFTRTRYLADMTVTQTGPTTPPNVVIANRLVRYSAPASLVVTNI